MPDLPYIRIFHREIVKPYSPSYFEYAQHDTHSKVVLPEVCQEALIELSQR